MFGLFGCTKQAPAAPQNPSGVIRISVESKLAEADIWLVPDTEANRKTTLWGTATVHLYPDDRQDSVAVEMAESDACLLRIIDSDGMYYAADGLILADGQTLTIRAGEEPMSAVAAVCNADGAVIAEYDMFAAKL